jgi:hypothetical protein
MINTLAANPEWRRLGTHTFATVMEAIINNGNFRVNYIIENFNTKMLEFVDKYFMPDAAKITEEIEYSW